MDGPRKRKAEGAYRILVAKTGTPLASRAVVARGFLKRAWGLLGHRALPDGEAMVLPYCRSIHTCGMWFPIDAVFVDRDWRVVSVRGRIDPWNITWPIRGAWGVIELPSGTAEKHHIGIGEQLQLAQANAQN